jgi:hypothetical protein
MQYRTFQGGPSTAPIAAEENRLILKALAEADWDMSKYTGPMQQLNPLAIFNRLGISQQDGYKQPQPQQGQDYQKAITQAMKSWLQKNADTYRIQKFLPGKGNEAGQPVPGVRIQPVPGVQIQPLPARIVPVQPGQGGIRLQIQPGAGAQGQAVPQIRGAIQLQVQPGNAPVEIEIKPEQPQR